MSSDYMTCNETAAQVSNDSVQIMEEGFARIPLLTVGLHRQVQNKSYKSPYFFYFNLHPAGKKNDKNYSPYIRQKGITISFKWSVWQMVSMAKAIQFYAELALRGWLPPPRSEWRNRDRAPGIPYCYLVWADPSKTGFANEQEVNVTGKNVFVSTALDEKNSGNVLVSICFTRGKDKNSTTKDNYPSITIYFEPFQAKAVVDSILFMVDKARHMHLSSVAHKYLSGNTVLSDNGQARNQVPQANGNGNREAYREHGYSGGSPAPVSPARNPAPNGNAGRAEYGADGNPNANRPNQNMRNENHAARDAGQANRAMPTNNGQARNQPPQANGNGNREANRENRYGGGGSPAPASQPRNPAPNGNAGRAGYGVDGNPNAYRPNQNMRNENHAARDAGQANRVMPTNNGQARNQPPQANGNGNREANRENRYGGGGSPALASQPRNPAPNGNAGRAGYGVDGNPNAHRPNQNMRNENRAARDANPAQSAEQNSRKPHPYSESTYTRKGFVAA